MHLVCFGSMFVTLPFYSTVGWLNRRLPWVTWEASFWTFWAMAKQDPRRHVFLASDDGNLRRSHAMFLFFPRKYGLLIKGL